MVSTIKWLGLKGYRLLTFQVLAAYSRVLENRNVDLARLRRGFEINIVQASRAEDPAKFDPCAGTCCAHARVRSASMYPVGNDSFLRVQSQQCLRANEGEHIRNRFDLHPTHVGLCTC